MSLGNYEQNICVVILISELVIKPRVRILAWSPIIPPCLLLGLTRICLTLVLCSALFFPVLNWLIDSKLWNILGHHLFFSSTKVSWKFFLLRDKPDYLKKRKRTKQKPHSSWVCLSAVLWVLLADRWAWGCLWGPLTRGPFFSEL